MKKMKKHLQAVYFSGILAGASTGLLGTLIAYTTYMGEGEAEILSMLVARGTILGAAIGFMTSAIIHLLNQNLNK